MKFVIATLIFANIGCLYKNIKRDKKLKQKEQELIFSENKKEFLDKYYELIKRNNEQISIIKHDIYNQLQIAYVAFKQNNINAIKMLIEVEKELDDIKSTKYCENELLNIILSIKTEEAKKYDINIELKIDYFIELNMEDIDVCNIFTNLLDNSIEAAKKNENKNVKLYIYEKNGYVIIKNENFCKCYKKNKIGKFETTKKDKKSHGYGIKIIEKTLEKYNGDLNVRIDNGIFRMIILLPQNKSATKK